VQYLTYKLKERGCEVICICEAGSSSICPKCGHKFKPKGRMFACGRCGLRVHRDVKGASGILSLYIGGQVFPGLVDIPLPKDIKYLRPDDFGRIGRIVGSSSVSGTRRSAEAGCGLGIGNK
jgi:putative transposase